MEHVTRNGCSSLNGGFTAWAKTMARESQTLQVKQTLPAKGSLRSRSDSEQGSTRQHSARAKRFSLEPVRQTQLGWMKASGLQKQKLWQMGLRPFRWQKRLRCQRPAAMRKPAARPKSEAPLERSPRVELLLYVPRSPTHRFFVRDCAVQ